MRTKPCNFQQTGKFSIQSNKVKIKIQCLSIFCIGLLSRDERRVNYGNSIHFNPYLNCGYIGMMARFTNGGLMNLNN